MLDRSERKQVFEEVRIITYCVILLSGMLSCTMPFHYLCDLEGYSCPFCGMRHAIDYVLELDFVSAYQSNRLIIVVILSAILMAVDCIAIVYRRTRRK